MLATLEHTHEHAKESTYLVSVADAAVCALAAVGVATTTAAADIKITMYTWCVASTGGHVKLVLDVVTGSLHGCPPPL
jgi:hypothetical protein